MKKKMINTEVFQVTQYQISRALKFWDLLIKYLMLSGFKVGHKQYYGTVAIKEGIELPVRVREKCRRVRINDNKWGFSELVPTGTLIFKLDTLRSKEWEDTKNKPLEQKIPIIVKYLEKKVQEEIKLKAEIKRRNQVYEATKKAQEELQLRKQVEEKRLKDLISECENWNKANQLRNYINAVRISDFKKRFNSPLEKRNWLEWVNKKVDEIDPLMGG
ncbi:hypothetical protein [Robiginitalea aurantiaca]|uniref:Uncharacterized protein n=1 Tax=Robiginitalea aurantiaca TaxID=3056915 RepID=A0ABT7WBD0_9FLAO|nr:hypothetical protein [Robiginitalea aurantiaca]MDM9630217.1 hypothetical protein [Robiginitalea aurantiaca]